MSTINKDLGVVTAYAYAVAGGFVGTEQEFEALLGDIANVINELENFSVTVTTLPAGSAATASYSEGTLALGIPKGDTGEKGDPGDPGEAAGFGAVSATVDAATGTPSVDVTASGPNTAKQFAFAFHNLKGSKGDTGTSITSITKTGTQGLVDTYTIAFSDGTTTTFTVTNGADGGVTEEEMEAAIAEAVGSIESDTAPAIVAHASGDIVILTDATDSEVKSCVTEVKADQDLHGQPGAWVGGKGKNLLKLPYYYPSGTIDKGVKFTVNEDGSIYLSGTMTSSGYATFDLYDSRAGQSDFILPAGTYTLNATDIASGLCGVFNGDTRESLCTSSQMSSSSFTLAEETRVYLRFSVSALREYNETFYPMLYAGSSPLTWEPYENLCPITGWTGGQIDTSRENMARVTPRVSADGQYIFFYAGDETTPTDGLVVKAGQRYSFRIRLPRVPSGGWALYGKRVGETGTITIIGIEQAVEKNAIYGATKNGKLAFWLQSPNSAFTQEDADAIQIYVGLNPSYVHIPYGGEQYTSDWGSQAGTVYIAKHDWTSGKMIVTHAAMVLDGTNHYFENRNNVWRAYFRDLPRASADTDSVRMSSFSSVSDLKAHSLYLTTDPSSWTSVFDDVTAINAFLAQHPQTVVYKLLTPVEYQLAPVAIDSMSEYFQAWSSSGDTAIDYRADTKRYIEKLTIPDEDDMMADKNIAASQFFMVGSSLYYSTAAITAGETIKPDVNCRAYSLAGALNFILAST